MEEHAAAPPAVERDAPALTQQEIEVAIHLLLRGKHNSWAALMARPEQIEAARKRAVRAKKAEAFRQQEAPINRAQEQARRGS